MMNVLKPVMVPINREGSAFIALSALLTFVATIFWTGFLFIGLPLTAWCIYFFRDPNRTTPVREGLVIAPADGVVCSVTEAPPPEELEMGAKPMLRIATFMNVFDVHVNRAPVDGTVVKMDYRPGKFVNADLDKASTDNERQSIRIETPQGKEIAVVQIAGLVARRILCDIEPGDELRAGERFGMIRFGSRVDLYLPKGVAPLVCEGQRMIAGETVMADLGGRRGKEPARKGEVR